MKGQGALGAAEGRDLPANLVHLARLALVGGREDVQRYIGRLARELRLPFPDTARALLQLLREGPTKSSPFRSETIAAVPVDLDSRMQLVRLEYPVTLESEPIWSEDVREALQQIVQERLRAAELDAAGLHPTKAALFIGPPGVGKTLGARWIARQLGLPLLVLDLATVISSFLGRTGSNFRNVLDYAKGVHCVLLIDELDALGKRRDDEIEIGELKRLVTVLLQELDEWPSRQLLLAATNHPDLLDRAVWRRFDLVLSFEIPDDIQLRLAVKQYLGDVEVPPALIDFLTELFRGSSYNDIERTLNALRRKSVLSDISLEAAIRPFAAQKIGEIPRNRRMAIAAALLKLGHSQREVSTVTGISRDTMRKAASGRN